MRAALLRAGAAGPVPLSEIAEVFSLIDRTRVVEALDAGSALSARTTDQRARTVCVRLCVCVCG